MFVGNHSNRGLFGVTFRLSRRQTLMARRQTFSSAVPHLNVTRPRLEALRQRLAQEEEQDETSTVMKQLKQSVNNNKKKKNTRTPTTNSTEDASLNDILQQLQDMPPIPSHEILTDSFQRQHSYLRISLVERCNLRCQYCMPPEGVSLQPKDKLLMRDEIVTLASLFHKHGVDKIRLTGGEPLLRHDVVDIIRDLSLVGIPHIGMTTNGVTLKRHLSSLIDAGLTHVNISCDSLKEDVFTNLTRRSGLQQVLQSMKAACELLPHGRVKLNVVVMKNINDGELQDFCHLTQQYPLDVRFIEWMPFFDNGWNAGTFVSYTEMLERLQPLDLQRIQDGPNDTTKWYTLPSSLGRIGFITSMSQHFCGTCNRLRLTADGKLKACLFGSNEISLRDALRRPDCSVDMLERLIHYTVQRKTFALGGHVSAQHIAEANDNRPMTLIGG